MRLQFSVVLVIASLFGISPIVAAQQDQPVDPAAAPAQPDPTAPSGPSASTGTASEVPAGQVFVLYENGQLTIKAHDVPLLEVLRAACAQIGAQIEAPPGASEPVFVEMGPAPARSVLTSLLTGSSFNYMVQAAEDDQNTLARLIVIPMSGGREMQSRDTVLEEASAEAPPPDVMIDPKEVATQMKGLIAEAKGEIARMGSDADPSLRENATQLFALLENSMDAVATGAAQSHTDDQPSPSAPTDDAPPGRPPHHRHRR